MTATRTALHTANTAPNATAIAARPAHRATPIPFRRLLHTEWRKSVDTRSARWLLAVVALTTVGATSVPILIPAEIEQSLPSYLSFSGLGLVLLLPVVSILTLTTEWTQRTVLVTFTQEPRRGRVLAAKILAGSLLALLGTLYAGLSATAGLAASSALGRTVTWELSAATAAGLLLFVLLNSLMGMAFGALLHNTAAAIVLFYVIPTTWTLLTMTALDRIREWLDTMQTFGWILAAEWDGHTAQILTSIGVWVVLPVTIGLVRTHRREIA